MQETLPTTFCAAPMRLPNSWGKSRKDIYRNPAGLPFFCLDQFICARKSTLRAEISKREAAARRMLSARRKAQHGATPATANHAEETPAA